MGYCLRCGNPVPTGGLCYCQTQYPLAQPQHHRCECHDCTQARARERNPFQGTLGPVMGTAGSAGPLPDPVVMRLT